MNINWADPPAWGALGVSLIALGVSWRGQHRANEAASRSADAADRSAVAAEQALALQQQEAADAAAAAAPRVELVIEHVGGNVYRLRNAGRLAARGITTDLTNLAEFADELPTGVDLGPNAGFRMTLAGGMTRQVPDELPLKWDGQAEYVAIPMP
ncbi:hypothetical protein ACWEO1_06290 [Kitasatospora cineracea]